MGRVRRLIVIATKQVRTKSKIAKYRKWNLTASGRWSVDANSHGGIEYANSNIKRIKPTTKPHIKPQKAP